MVKINTVQKAIKVFVPKAGRFVQKPELVSVFTEPSKIKYVHNVLEYKSRQITPQEVKSFFIDGKIDGGYLRDEMKRVKRKLLKSSLTDISNFKKWRHSVNLSRDLSDSDLIEIADFMNMHNGRFMNIWKGYCSEDSIPNIEKLALFVRSIKRIDKLKFYKNLGENEWENCIDGIISKPSEVVRALMEYKLDSRKINNAISYGTNSEEIKSQIKAIEKFLDKQSLKHDMEVYRGEKELGIFKSIKLGNITLKDKLDEFALKLETCNITQDDVDKFVDRYLSGKKVKQERFLSTSIEKEAGDMYAKKVLWRIFVPAKTKALMIESYNVERLSEAELLLQKGSNLLIENAKYDKLKRRWVINASVEPLY